MLDLHKLLSEEDRRIASGIIGSLYWPADIQIAPDGGEPYLYRWYVTPHDQAIGNVYFHIQVDSDPERPLHDHPWDNCSVILSGGYDELISFNPAVSTREGFAHMEKRRKGDVIFRKAEHAHRLLLPAGIPYTMTLFTTGPKKREWGFWLRGVWHDRREVLFEENGISKFKMKFSNETEE